jgi:hypothetical protein
MTTQRHAAVLRFERRTPDTIGAATDGQGGPVRRNGHGQAPQSEFYRLRYPAGRQVRSLASRDGAG